MQVKHPDWCVRTNVCGPACSRPLPAPGIRAQRRQWHAVAQARCTRRAAGMSSCVAFGIASLASGTGPDAGESFGGRIDQVHAWSMWCLPCDVCERVAMAQKQNAPGGIRGRSRSSEDRVTDLPQGEISPSVVCHPVEAFAFAAWRQRARSRAVAMWPQAVLVGDVGAKFHVVKWICSGMCRVTAGIYVWRGAMTRQLPWWFDDVASKRAHSTLPCAHVQAWQQQKIALLHGARRAVACAGAVVNRLYAPTCASCGCVQRQCDDAIVARHRIANHHPACAAGAARSNCSVRPHGQAACAADSVALKRRA